MSDGPIPEGVYFSIDGGNFHSMTPPHKGMGVEFWNKWRARLKEFPTKPVDYELDYTDQRNLG